MINLVEQGMISLVELNHLRTEAMQLFEQCLTIGSEMPLVAFIERQVIQDPPRLHLLREVADDIQQRLLSLREYHFDVRDHVVRTLREGYNIDITPLTQPAQLEQYHHLTADQVMNFVQENSPGLSNPDMLLLRKMIEASLEMASQLHSDIQLTIQLYHLVTDWLEGISATVARRYWNIQANPQQDSFHH